jgi:hypothetical protein
MSKHIISEKKASHITGGIFLILLAFLSITNTWWPGILLVLAIIVGLRQLFRGKYYDVLLSMVIFGGLFIIFQLKIKMAVLVPVLLVVAGIYIISREFVQPDEPTEEEIEDEIQHEIAEDQDEKNER